MYIAILIICTICGLILAGMYYHSKNHTVDMICKHPELSDEKVKAITKNDVYSIQKKEINFISSSIYLLLYFLICHIYYLRILRELPKPSSLILCHLHRMKPIFYSFINASTLSKSSHPLHFPIQ